MFDLLKEFGLATCAITKTLNLSILVLISFALSIPNITIITIVRRFATSRTLSWALLAKVPTKMALCWVPEEKF